MAQGNEARRFKYVDRKNRTDILRRDYLRIWLDRKFRRHMMPTSESLYNPEYVWELYLWWRERERGTG